MTDTAGATDTVRTRAIEFFEKLRGVSQPEAAEESNIAGGILVAVKFKREGVDTWAWYFEKGEIRKPLYRGTELAAFIEGQITPRPFRDLIRATPFQDLIKLTVVSALTVIFAIAVIYIVIDQPDNKSLQVLTGLLGLTIGYFVGKVDVPNPPR
jgi:hypothetical protein